MIAKKILKDTQSVFRSLALHENKERFSRYRYIVNTLLTHYCLKFCFHFDNWLQM